ncbi:hypothetical protein CI102_11466 [Trichoderma harzianum]|uniref:Uncharacterized protein n=1 Tax=Trichoderma harzianum CBS 226.95 TaxID=983964 RepID=A0A2T4ADF1_TRIHA|nr:hypothetical protein M431DRAFT_437681 [Trichoderma harzianum CBS 226.95]PKK43153.1 hypothetical protein CI102_11466 [Trichoderma harzianum]PTB55114.1 hypothetical protein M431DRAFT_437681 [Trichoderma harzianum CBS 226.95]
MQSALTQWRLGQGHRYGKPEGQHLCSHDDDVCFWDAEKDVKAGGRRIAARVSSDPWPRLSPPPVSATSHDTPLDGMPLSISISISMTISLKHPCSRSCAGPPHVVTVGRPG